LRKLLSLILWFLLVSAPPLPAAGLNLREILNHKELYDRKVVEIIGEVTGVAVKSGSLCQEIACGRWRL
jgi:hypothetical protein